MLQLLAKYLSFQHSYFVHGIYPISKVAMFSINYLTAIGVCLSVLIINSAGQLEQQEPPDVSTDKETICAATKTAEPDMKVDVSGFMDYDDLLRLVVWNHKYNLRKGTKAFAFPAEVNWKRDVLNKLTAIFTKICPAEIVNPQFINVAKELFMIYQNSVNESMDHSAAWETFYPTLDKCREEAKPLEMMSIGFDSYAVLVKTRNGNKERVVLFPPAEFADSSLDIDLIIDTMWWVFSFNFGACYWKPEGPGMFASRFKRLFYGDFLNKLKTRWLHSGPETDFGVIFGDFNLKTTLRNARMCVTAAYTKNGLADRQLVRSLTLAPANYGIETGINRKVGDSV